VQISEDFWQVDKTADVKDEDPAGGGKKLVQNRSFLVRTEPLKPDHSVNKRYSNDVGNH
jgi:hypothetical protein